MKVGVMQPYLFPYLGYYQLVNCVDNFVLYDDVNYIKGGYINRNTILSNGKKQRFTLPVMQASSNKKIKDLLFTDSTEKILRSFEHAYSKSSNFDTIYPLIKKVIESKDRSITKVCKKSISIVFEYLEVDKNLVNSSNLKYNRDSAADQRLIEITRSFNANHYVNSIGGKELYDTSVFESNDIKLSFIKMKDVSYPQAGNIFVPNLSIIDVLMWCSKEEVRSLFDEYTLI